METIFAIGGKGHAVEIDESFVHCKYYCGRLGKEQHWVFGDYDVNTKMIFVVPVDQCNATTLLPIIEKYILPRTMVYLVLDLWAAYNTVSQATAI